MNSLFRICLTATLLGCGALAWAAAGPTAGSLTGAKPATSGPGASFDADLAALTRAPHRLAGTPEALEASKYLQQRLKQIGADEVFVQNFPVANNRALECSMTVDGKTSGDIFPMRPNLFQASVTPEEGLSGQTVYAGNGTLEEYKESAKGKIVLLDFSAGRRWLTAFAMGAKAVVFLGQDTPAEETFHHVNMPAFLPRYYVTDETARKLHLREGSHQMTIRSTAQWRMLQGRNVVAVIRGTNPKFRLNRDEALLFSAKVDSLSEVPLLSPGARDAANAASLLALAEYFKAHPPRRDILIAFFDGDAQSHAGARAFFGDLYRVKSGRYRLAADSNLKFDTLDARLKMFQDEKAWMESVQKVLEQGNLFEPAVRKMPNWYDALLRLQREAGNLSGDLREQLQLLRVDQLGLQSEIEGLKRQAQGRMAASAPASTEPSAQRLVELQAQAKALAEDIDVRAAQDQYWNHLLRALNDQRHPLDPGFKIKSAQTVDRTQIALKYDIALKEVQHIVALRLEEIQSEIRRLEQSQAMAASIGDNRDVIVLDLVMNLGDESARWTFLHGDDSEGVYNRPDKISEYNGVFKAIMKVADAAGASVPHLERRTVESMYNVRMFAPGLFVHSGNIAGMFAVQNLALMTPMDRRVRDGQPTDVVARTGPKGERVSVLNTANMIAARREMEPFLKALADEEDLSSEGSITPDVTYVEATFDDGTEAGPSAMMLSSASAMADQPARDALVAIIPPTQVGEVAKTDLTPPGFEMYPITKVAITGRYNLPPISTLFYAGPSNHADLTVALFDGRGLISRINSTRTAAAAIPLSTAASVLFQGPGITLVGYGFDRRAVITQVMKAASTSPLSEDRSLVRESVNLLTLFARRDTNNIKLFNALGMVMLGLPTSSSGGENADARNTGQGVPLDPFNRPSTISMSAQDLHSLNSGRLNMLKEHRILEPSLELLHSMAGDLLAKSARMDEPKVQEAVATSAASAAISRAVYSPLLAVINDLVVAVVMLLLLAMPFAYAIERLLVGTPHIYRQIGWFIAFFLVTFVVLFLVNPAFRIAATPIIIFLAFAIILLSAMVVIIMTRKLEAEVRRLRGLGSSVHSCDVSRLGTMMAAVAMGISTMRRRPVRTLLTATTVVLLTFTILTFASFTSSWGNRRTSVGPLSGPPRMLVRSPLWTRMNEGVVEMLQGYLTSDATVVPRYWVAQSATEVEANRLASRRNRELLLSDPSGAKIVPIASAIGLDMRDLDRLSELRAVLNGNLELLKDRGVFLTEAVVREMGIKPGDAFVLDGVPCILAGTINIRKITNYRLLEGSSVLPVDYEASGGGAATGYSTQEATASTAGKPQAESESAQFITFGPDRVAIMPVAMARRIGGRVASVNIYPNEPSDVDRIGQQVATLTQLPTYVGSRGGVFRLYFTSLTEASGWKDLVIPVVLGGLIIFATMLGSVSDREKEIYAFSALGLAPPHVASLFFAEAGVYAVVGGMGGYLLGQVVARGMGFLSEHFGLLSVPTMNYSSTNAIVTVLVVMCTVLISTIYPAIKASRSANPGIQRQWRIPKPKEDLYDIVFPFTVSAYDITGVLSFLKEHFDNYSDTALGSFTASGTRIFRQRSNEMLGLEAEVALAPFDLGVSEKFALLVRASEIKGIEEIRILLGRLSGTRGDWQRSNKVFVHELRRQLLIWRSLPPDIMEKYRQKTLQQWNALPVEDIQPETFGATA